MYVLLNLVPPFPMTNYDLFNENIIKQGELIKAKFNYEENGDVICSLEFNHIDRVSMQSYDNKLFCNLI